MALGNGLGRIGGAMGPPAQSGREFKIKVMLTSRQFGGVKRGAAIQHVVQPSCHGGNLPCNGVGMLSPQVAQITMASGAPLPR